MIAWLIHMRNVDCSTEYSAMKPITKYVDEIGRAMSTVAAVKSPQPCGLGRGLSLPDSWSRM
jgi:hypothetical protein